MVRECPAGLELGEKNIKIQCYHSYFRHGEAIYQSKLNCFLQSVCILLDLKLEDLYFEQDVRILCINNYTLEAHKLT